MSLPVSTIKTCKFQARYFCHGFTCGSLAAMWLTMWLLHWLNNFLLFAGVLLFAFKIPTLSPPFLHFRTRHQFLSALVVGWQTFHLWFNFVSAVFCSSALLSLRLREQGEVQQTMWLHHALEMLIRIDLDGDIKKLGWLLSQCSVWGWFRAS